MNSNDYTNETAKGKEVLNQYHELFGKPGTHYSRKLLAEHALILRDLAWQEAIKPGHGSPLLDAISAAWNHGFMMGYKAGCNDSKKKPRNHKNSKKQAV